MCNPAAVQIGVSIASAAAAGYAQKQQGEHEDDVAKYNARVTENEAEKVRAKGVEEENTLREKNAQLLAKQRAQIGASSVDLSSGTPLDIQEDTVVLGEVDALRVRTNFQEQAEGLDEQASLTRSMGKAAKERGQAAFTPLASATGVSSKWFLA
jgi:hypothetical protein